MKLYLLVLVAALGLITVAGQCGKLPERQWERGHFEPIGGRPYNLPDGLSVRYIIGAEDEIPTSFLPLAFSVLNNTTRRINVQMPAGLVFTPNNPDYQYMMILQQFAFSVPAEQETTVFLPTYCCNEGLDEPDEESFYAIDIQVWERELCELFDLVRNKRLDYEEAVDLAQSALFEITDGAGLTDSTRQKLENLP